MQSARMGALLLGLLCPGAAAGAAANPLGKVLQLMDDLAAKITAQAAEEAKAYKQFSDWCVDAERNKGFEIQEASTRQQKLEAEISKQSADGESASSKIEQLAASVGTADGELKTATVLREKEAKEFSASEAEMTDAIDTLGRAIKIISREMAKNPAAALAQVDSTNMQGLIQALSTVVDAASFSSADRSKLMALVQAREGAQDDDADLGAPAAATYKSHSTGIIDLLEDLKEKAEEQLAGLRKAEKNAQHNFDMLKQSLEDQLKADSRDLEAQKSAKALAEEAKATAQGNLQATLKALADAQEGLATAQNNCRTTQADHEATVQSREEELKVIAQAKEILQSSTGGATEQAYGFLQLDQATATGSRLHTRADLANVEVIAMVKQLARKHHSQALSQLASQIAAVAKFGASAGEDPFVKIRALISDLIGRLEQQAGADATEKAYCDEQLAKTEAKKADLEDSINKLTAKIDQAASASAGLKADVAQLQSELATLASEQAQMDKIRGETHAAFAKAKAELEQGLQGVRKALGVLRDYYGAALLQQPAAPGQHAKASGAGSGIIGILEVVESDFAKSLSTEELQEGDAQAEYEKVTQENKVTKALKEQDVKYKTQQHVSLDKTIAELTSDRNGQDAELSAVLEYYAKIKERCIAKPEAYEERAERRAAEINGLKEALRVLEEESAFVQRRKRGLPARFLAAAA